MSPSMLVEGLIEIQTGKHSGKDVSWNYFNLKIEWMVNGLIHNKRMNLNDTVFSICTNYPDAVEIMNELGFVDIVKPGMMQTAGRFMTILKGARMKKIDLEVIIAAFENKGFEVVSDD